MCGIYGMVAFAGELQDPGRHAAMARLLRHRGPDDSGVRISPSCVLGAERLRITDLRQEAAQPFADPDGGVWLACNGAIYNAPALRAQFADYPYASRSDVEPLLPLYRAHAVAMFGAVDGMFAIAVWDAPARRLVLARDRAGEKPLFWRQVGSEIWFASELQPLLPDRHRTVDPVALLDYTQFGFVRAPRTIVEGIHKVLPGTALVFTGVTPVVHRFWPPAVNRDSSLDAETAERALEARLTEAVDRQLASDVPVGVFASGGLDSSLLTAIAARGRGHRVRTFAVGFADPRYDERQPAADLARVCGTRHESIMVGDTALLAAFDRATDRIAEPIGDPALLPTMLLASHARQSVGVVLSGEGADELFGGYPTYLGHRLAPAFSRLPRAVRSGFARALDRLPASHGKVTWDYLLRRFVGAADAPLLARHVAWFGTGLSPDVLAQAYRRELDLGDADPGEALARVMFFDYRTYLADGLLTKIDRATMLSGLEARAPYLDRGVTELAWQLPTSLTVRGLDTKWLLKRVALRHLPAAFVLRRKRGLSVPIAGWINGGLGDEVDRLLHTDRLTAAGLFEPARVQAVLAEHRAGHANRARELWPLIVFERWRERWMGEP